MSALCLLETSRTEADIRKKLRAIAKRKISLAEKLRWARVDGFSDGYNKAHDFQMRMRVLDVQEQRKVCQSRKCEGFKR